MATEKFSVKIWAKKIVLATLAVAIAGGMAVWQDNIVWLALVPIFQAVQNFIKHF